MKVRLPLHCLYCVRFRPQGIFSVHKCQTQLSLSLPNAPTYTDIFHCLSGAATCAWWVIEAEIYCTVGDLRANSTRLVNICRRKTTPRSGLTCIHIPQALIRLFSTSSKERKKQNISSKLIISPHRELGKNTNTEISARAQARALVVF